VNKFALTTLLILSFAFLFSKVAIAESGCGGTEFCQDTKIVNEIECNYQVESQSCKRDLTGQSTTINCTATQDDCYSYETGTACRYSQNLEECEPTGRKKVSCCSGAGGGNYECNGETELIRDCLPRSSCNDDRRGARCGEGNQFWCFSLQCMDCAATDPSVPEVSFNETGNSATISWNAGTGGVSQSLYVGSDQTMVNNNCTGAGTPCVYSSANATSPTEVPGLTPGTFYYAKVVNYKDAACSAESSQKFISCNNITPLSMTLKPNEAKVLTATLTGSSETPTVNFSVNNGVVSVSPLSDNDGTDGYKTTVTAGPGSGQSVVTSGVAIGAITYCSADTAVDIIPPGAWWQVGDGDVSAGGDLTSDVPNGNYFDLSGSGGYPGIPIYSGVTNLTASNVSPPGFGWLAQSGGTDGKIYDYQFFANQIPADTVITTVPNGNVDGSFFESGGTLSYGYYWYKYTGNGTNLSVDTPIDLTGTDRKIILLVEGAGLTIKGDIVLTDGREFFGAFVNGAIDVDPLVTSLEGIYLADSTFGTGIGIDQLHVRGSIASYGGVALQRDLNNDTNPSEFFEYAPDQILMFPTKLGARKISWKEVAP